MSPMETDYRLAAGELAGLWTSIRRSLEQLVELGSTRTPSERIRHECENLLRQGSIATTIHREIAERVPLQIPDSKGLDLNDVERRILVLVKMVSDRGWTQGEGDVAEAVGILKQLPDFGLDTGRPIDRYDCNYSALAGTICWMGREFQLKERQCLLVEHAWHAWEEGSGWFTKQSAAEVLGSESSDYRPKHSFEQGSDVYSWLFESDGGGRYRLKVKPPSV